MLGSLIDLKVSESSHDNKIKINNKEWLLKFKMYLLGENDSKPKNAEWAEKICGVSADQIKSIARKISKERTLITVAWSLQRAQNGEQPYWMATTLAAMLGQIGLPGGGIGFGYGAIGGVGVPIKNFGGLSLPKGKNNVSDFIADGDTTNAGTVTINSNSSASTCLLYTSPSPRDS